MATKIPLGITKEQWETMIKGLENNPNTINDYRKVLNLLHKYKDGSFHITTLTPEQAKEYYAYLDQRLEEGTLSKNTVHRYKATLRSIGSRLEESQRGYTNPFRNLIKNEIRKSTDYATVTFASPKDIQKIIEHIDDLKPTEAILLRILLNLGLTPAQIEKVRVCDFELNKQGELILTIPMGEITEVGVKEKKDSNYLQQGWPVKYARKNAKGDIVWAYAAQFKFFEAATKAIQKQIPTIGKNTDTRPFFMTPHHYSYSYRSIHHLILKVCQNAGVTASITPYQLSMYGMIRSYLLDSSLRKHAVLDKKLSEASSEEKANIQSQIQKVEETFLPLAKQAWVGNWLRHYPLPFQKQIDSMIQQKGEESLLPLVLMK